MSPSTRAEASQRVRESIVAATVTIAAREGVAAVTHRRVAAEAGVSLSSTTWHFAAKADILEAALQWTARHEVARIAEIAERLGDTTSTRRLGGGARGLADRAGDDRAGHRGRALPPADRAARLARRARGPPRLGPRPARARGGRARALDRDADLDIRLVVAALDGLRLSVLLSGEETGWLRDAVRRQLQALLA